MVKVDRLARVTWLYHFTDSRNVPLIRELGGLWSTAKLREMGVRFYPGGNQHSLDADRMFGVDQFVHLCVSMEHPLAYLAKNDGRIEKLQWIYIDDAQGIFELEGARYCPEVANKSGVSHYPIEVARESFDVEALSYLDWKVGNNYARRQAVEKCEILVPDHVPLKFFEERLPHG
ncbi:MAG: DarT ssDNA thymidine ADP-ribosyltransferase family protein [Bryobacteraceae bacterium]